MIIAGMFLGIVIFIIGDAFGYWRGVNAQYRAMTEQNKEGKCQNR